jgi:hypothetical protein
MRGSPRNWLSELADTSYAGYSRGQGDDQDWEIHGDAIGLLQGSRPAIGA